MNDALKTQAELLAELALLRAKVAKLEGEAAALTRAETTSRGRDILESMRAVVAEADESGRVLYVSPTVVDLVGFTAEEMLQQPGFEWIHPHDMPKLGELLHKAIATGQPAQAEFRVRHKDGRWVWLDATGRCMRTEAGEVRLVCFARDISELKRSDHALRVSEDRLRMITENASDLIAEVDDQGRFLFVSANCERLIGRTPEQLIGRSVRQAFDDGNLHPDDRERVVGGFRQELVELRGEGGTEFRFRHPDGTWHWFESRGKAYTTPDGAVRAVVISRDVTEQRRAQRALAEGEERYRLVTAATSDLISEHDDEGRLLYVSPTSLDVLGYAPGELVGTTPIPLFHHPDDVDGVIQAFAQTLEQEEPVRVGPYRMRHRDGSWRWFETTGLRYRRRDGEIRCVGATRDVTERIEGDRARRQLEEQMQQAQKLESLGVMAGGIAHDFNNLLTPILGDASLALMDLPEDSPARSRLQKIQKAAHRAAGLTNQMLAYAGQGPLLVESLDLSQLVLEMAQLLETAVASKAAMTYEMAVDLPPVEGDATQLSQVVMNLITNASEAIEEKSGRIAVRTGTADGERVPRDALLHSELRDGPHVWFEVADNGCGMDEERRARIFDPFYTTKFTGRGLGLAAVLGIVRGHRGAIELESDPGRGTRFRVYFPAQCGARVEADAVPSAVSGWRADGTVLVVDDDDAVRALARDTLRRAGLRVLCAADGQEAVRVFRQRADEIDAVLLDRTMPGPTGEEVFDAIQALRPDMPVVLVSGYSEERAVEHFRGRGLAGFLQKPFEPAALLGRLREILSA